MTDQNKQVKSKVLTNILIGVAIVMLGGGINFLGYSLWTVESRLAGIDVNSVKLSELKESTNKGFETASNKADTRFADFTNNIYKLFEEQSKNADKRFTDFTNNINKLFEEQSKNADKRFTEFTNNINKLFEEQSKNADKRFVAESERADKRFADFAENINLGLVEIIARVMALEESIKPSYNVVAED